MMLRKISILCTDYLSRKKIQLSIHQLKDVRTFVEEIDKIDNNEIFLGRINGWNEKATTVKTLAETIKDLLDKIYKSTNESVEENNQNTPISAEDLTNFHVKLTNLMEKFEELISEYDVDYKKFIELSKALTTIYDHLEKNFQKEYTQAKLSHAKMVRNQTPISAEVQYELKGICGEEPQESISDLIKTIKGLQAKIDEAEKYQKVALALTWYIELLRQPGSALLDFVNDVEKRCEETSSNESKLVAQLQADLQNIKDKTNDARFFRKPTPQISGLLNNKRLFPTESKLTN